MSIGSFILIKNEILWIRAHLKSWLPVLDQMIFFDGNSNDGTLEVIKEFQKGQYGHKIKLVEDKDPGDLKDDYVRLFDECLRALNTDYAFFLHPDMVLESGELKLDDSPAYFTTIKSFAGEPGGPVYEIKGRAQRWKNIYRLRNPDLGLHYFGHYGAANEDCYFREITGDDHEFHGEQLDNYPYSVLDSGLTVLHYSDVRPYQRRLDRMIKCLINQGQKPEVAAELAKAHSRVTLKDGLGLSFTPAEYPEVFKENAIV